MATPCWHRQRKGSSSAEPRPLAHRVSWCHAALGRRISPRNARIRDTGRGLWAVITLRVHQDGDDVFLTWHLDKRIADCRGFAVHRRKQGSAEDVLPSFAGFENEKWKAGAHKPSSDWPIQKFWW